MPFLGIHVHTWKRAFLTMYASHAHTHSRFPDTRIAVWGFLNGTLLPRYNTLTRHTTCDTAAANKRQCTDIEGVSLSLHVASPLSIRQQRSPQAKYGLPGALSADPAQSCKQHNISSGICVQIPASKLPENSLQPAGNLGTQNATNSTSAAIEQRIREAVSLRAQLAGNYTRAPAAVVGSMQLSKYATYIYGSRLLNFTVRPLQCTLSVVCVCVCVCVCVLIYIYIHI
jgi:hypothetical protein